MRFRSVLLSISLLYIIASPIIGQVEVSRIPKGFTFDGHVTDEEWGSVTPFELTVMTPEHRRPLSQQSVIRMAYDDDYVYLSGALYDTEPSKILANNRLRDGGDESTEWFGLLIDSYNDKQNALSFFTSPTGSRWDASVQNDANGRDPINLSWNAFWDAKVQITDKGWFAELRIPFSSLQYQITDGDVIMGISTWRYISRYNEMQISPDISPALGDMGSFMPSQAAEYIFKNVKQKKPFYVTPYVLGGVSQLHQLNASETKYERETDVKRNVGLDLKYGLTNNYTMDLTVNTDFAQVEADDQQVNLTRFSLFFPEKRLFFQQRAGIFSYSVGSRNNLFYSRRIGIDGSGNAIPILGGVRVTGRSGDIDLGVISMQTRGTDDFTSNNYSVFRIKKRILNENSDAGILLTNRIATDGSYNTVFGLDSQIKAWDDNFLTLKYAQSIDDQRGLTPFSLSSGLFWMSISNRNQKGLRYGISFSRTGEDFQADVGFFDRDAYTRLGSRLQYSFFTEGETSIFRHGPSIVGVSYWDNLSDTYNNAFYRGGYDWIWKNGQELRAQVVLRYDDITSEFTLANIATVPVDQYIYPGLRAEYKTANGKPYIIRATVESGAFYDGRRSTLSLNPVYNVSNSLGLEASYEYNKVNFDNRNQEFAAHIARIKASIMFSTKFSISSFIQYNSLNDLFLGNIRLRYNPREGNDLFIVYNSDWNSDRDLFFPRLPVSNQSSLLVKYSYTFTL